MFISCEKSRSSCLLRNRCANVNVNTTDTETETLFLGIEIFRSPAGAAREPEHSVGDWVLTLIGAKWSLRSLSAAVVF